MRVKKVTVNHFERNYFGDYDEMRVDEMVSPTAVKVMKAIDKLHRRHRSNGEDDVMFVTNFDGTGWRLMYDYDPSVGAEHGKKLLIRHYTQMKHGSWDTEDEVTPAKAKRLILVEEM